MARISRDYQLHFGNKPSVSRLLFLEFLRLGGVFFSTLFLWEYATAFYAPLLYLMAEPSVPLSTLYSILVLFSLSWCQPELTPISRRSYTISQFVARMTGLLFQACVVESQKMSAFAILKSRSLDSPEIRIPYQYSPIRSPGTIRLLRIESREETTLCLLETVKLANCPTFWAVSYLWGSEEKPKLLKISRYSRPDFGYIAVTSNCAAAIEALIPIGVRYLWVDALCINQDDRSEKEIQVPLMGQIYSQASLVVGHLPTESIYSVGPLIHRLVQAFGNGYRFGMNSGSSLLIYRALSDVFTHQYFQRAWIVQEIVLA